MAGRLAVALWLIVAAATPPACAGATPAPLDAVVPGSTSPIRRSSARRCSAIRTTRGEPTGNGRSASTPGLPAPPATTPWNMARLGVHAHVLPVRGQHDLGQRMHRQSLSFRRAAENIARDKALRLLGRPIAAAHAGCSFTYSDTGAPVPRHSYASLAVCVVRRWLASPRHRASLLSPDFTRLGTGIAADPAAPACGDFYLVQDLAD